MENDEEIISEEKVLTPEELAALSAQDTRLVTTFQAQTLEKDAKKHWDLFYKRNESRFFKDRHWTTREFKELLDDQTDGQISKRTLMEIGCGVGNFIYPLIEEKLNFNIIACDLSPHAIEILKTNKLYHPEIVAFTTDITTEDVFLHVEQSTVDIATLIFVLSAIHPDKFLKTLKIIGKLLRPGGILLFRDYGLYDMAQLRFKAGHKIADNFYMRQDGTRSYYFSKEYFFSLVEDAGLKIMENNYVHRKTVNKKEGIDVPRIFLQAKVVKPG